MDATGNNIRSIIMAKKKFSVVDEIHAGLIKVASVSRTGEVKIKRSDVRALIEESFMKGAKAAAGGDRVRFPIVGALVRKEVKARKGGKGVNPFTGEAMEIKARPATKKPRWSFPKSLKEIFANKKHW
jgi:nucleoid DNA-binding protein